MTHVITLEEKVDPKRAAMVVVDMQNDFCSPDGAVMKLEDRDTGLVRGMIPRLVSFIEEARKARMPIIYVTGIYDDLYLSDVQWVMNTAQVKLCQEGSWGAELIPEIKPLPGEPIVRKHRYSAFINTDLDLILRSRGIRSLLMTGVATSVCVDSTARDGFMHDYHIVYVEDCMSNVWSTTDLHDATLEIGRRFFGVVTTSKEIVSIWRR